MTEIQNAERTTSVTVAQLLKRQQKHLIQTKSALNDAF